MENEGEGPDRPSLSTVTHARLRADQGDLDGARRLLREILRQRPGHEEASELLGSLAGRKQTATAVEPTGAEAVVAEPAGPAPDFRTALGGGEARERIRRLRKYLERIDEIRGE